MASHKAPATPLLLTLNLLLFIMVCSCAPTCTSPPRAPPKAPTHPPRAPTPRPKAPTHPPRAPTPPPKAPTHSPPAPVPAPKAPTSPPPPVPRPSPTPPPSPQGNCSMDILKLGVCANLLNAVNVTIGRPPTDPCCTLISSLVDLEAAVCLCTALRANVLGINLNIPLSLSLILNNCGRNSSGYQCN